MSRRAPVTGERAALSWVPAMAPVIIIIIALQLSQNPAVRSAHLGPGCIREPRGRTSDLVASADLADAAVAIT